MDFFHSIVKNLSLPSTFQDTYSILVIENHSVEAQSSSQTIEEETVDFDLELKLDHDLSVVPTVERLEYALCAYHKAFMEYKTYGESLLSGQKNDMKQPLYRGFARQFDVHHTTLMR